MSSDQKKLCGANSPDGMYACEGADRHLGAHYSDFAGYWHNSGFVKPATTGELFDVAERMGEVVVDLKAGIEKLRSERDEFKDGYEKALRVKQELAVSLAAMTQNRDEVQANLAAMTDNRNTWQRRAAKWRNQLSEVRAEQSSELSFDDYLLATDVTAVYPEVGNPDSRGVAAYLALGVASEAGEVADVIKKALRNGDALDNPDVEARLRGELGDVLWYVARFCREKNWSLADIAKENLEKLNARKESGELKQRRDYIPGLSEAAAVCECGHTATQHAPDIGCYTPAKHVGFCPCKKFTQGEK